MLQTFNYANAIMQIAHLSVLKYLPRTINVTLQVWKKAPIFDFSALPIIPGDMEKRLLAGLSGVAPAEDCDVVCNVSMLMMVLSGDLKICWLVVF